MSNNLDELINSGKYGAFIKQEGEQLNKAHPSKIMGFAFGKEQERKSIYVVLPLRIAGGDAEEIEAAKVSDEKLLEDIKEFKPKIKSLTPAEAVKQLTDLLKNKNYSEIKSEKFPNKLFLRPSYRGIDKHTTELGYSEILLIFPNE